MTFEDIVRYCADKQGASVVLKTEWGSHLAMLDKKFFALIGEDKAGEPIISLKCDPFKSEDLRLAFSGIIEPGYYLNKKHWNSIKYTKGISEELIMELIDDSYNLVMNSLPKKVQSGLLDD